MTGLLVAIGPDVQGQVKGLMVDQEGAWECLVYSE